MALNGHMRPDSLYIALDSRPLADEYHWALVSTDEFGAPTLRHASNLNGPWVHEEKPFDPGQRMMLIALVRVGDVISVRRSKLSAVCRSIPVDLGASIRTDEPFNCRTWVMDTLVCLGEEAVVLLSQSVDKVEQVAKNWATRLAEVAEVGAGATVVDQAFPAQNVADV